MLSTTKSFWQKKEIKIILIHRVGRLNHSDSCLNCHFMWPLCLQPLNCEFILENHPDSLNSILSTWDNFFMSLMVSLGFPSSSTGEESACNAADPGSIPGSGRSPGEGTGYPLQCFGASLVTQTVTNPPAMWETGVQSLGWEDPLEEGMTTHSWRILMDRGACQAKVCGITKSQTQQSD